VPLQTRDSPPFAGYSVLAVASSLHRQKTRKAADSVRALQAPAEELTCYGCRAEKRGFYCDKHCRMTKCALRRVSTSAENAGIPLYGIEGISAQMPIVLNSGMSARIREVGYEKWYAEMIEHYSCPKCHTSIRPTT